MRVASPNARTQTLDRGQESCGTAQMRSRSTGAGEYQRDVGGSIVHVRERAVHHDDGPYAFFGSARGSSSEHSGKECLSKPSPQLIAAARRHPGRDDDAEKRATSRVVRAGHGSFTRDSPARRSDHSMAARQTNGRPIVTRRPQGRYVQRRTRGVRSIAWSSRHGLPATRDVRTICGGSTDAAKVVVVIDTSGRDNADRVTHLIGPDRSSEVGSLRPVFEAH